MATIFPQRADGRWRVSRGLMSLGGPQVVDCDQLGAPSWRNPPSGTPLPQWKITFRSLKTIDYGDQ